MERWPQVGETWWSVGPWTLMSVDGNVGTWRTPTPMDSPRGWRVERYHLDGCARHWLPPGPEMDARMAYYGMAT